MRKQRHRHDQQGDVGDDIHGGVKEPDGFETHAGAADGGVPEAGDGEAVDKGADDSPGAVGGDDSHDDVAGETEALVGEDTQVLEQDGELGGAQAGVVEGDGGP